MNLYVYTHIIIYILTNVHTYLSTHMLELHYCEYQWALESIMNACVLPSLLSTV